MNNQSLEAVTFNLRRDYVYSLQFYLRKQLPEWIPGDSNTKLVFTNYEGTEELEKKGVECFHSEVIPPVTLCGAPFMNKVRERPERKLSHGAAGSWQPR